MSDCVYCSIINGKTKSEVVYEDDTAIAFLSENPASLGHVIVIPKKHYTIFEQVPDEEISLLFNTVNKISKAVFESLGVHGTNIIVENGVAAGQKSSHFSINIIPRTEGDGIDFAWSPMQLTEEQMSTVELTLKGNSQPQAQPQQQAQPQVFKATESDETPKMNASDKENYMIRQLQRIP